MTASNNGGWHLDKRVSIGQILSILALTAAVFTWKGNIDVINAKQDVQILHIEKGQEEIKDDIKDIKKSTDEILKRL